MVDRVTSERRGVRFAPSPTGRLHVGNLRTAWVSWRLARELKQPWIVRFEDIDRLRVKPGAQEAQLADLALLGMVPDEVVVQSERHLRHFACFEAAVQQGVVYACGCSRKEVTEELQRLASAQNGTGLSDGQRVPCYSGRCRDQQAELKKRELGWRFRSHASDRGEFDFLVAKTTGHGPAHFTPAYPWACAIDDFEGNYLLRVRAWDLAEAEHPQAEVRAWLGEVERAWVYHTALVVQDDGHRLEKRTQGVTLPELMERGLSKESILSSWHSSFESVKEAHRLVLAPEFPCGEMSRRLSLCALLSMK